MSEEPTRSYDEPHDRLTGLCAVMTEALDAQPNTDDVRCVVFLSDDERGGLVTHGYGEGEEEQLQAWLDVFSHLRALMRANGKDLALVPVMQDPESQ